MSSNLTRGCVVFFGGELVFSGKWMGRDKATGKHLVRIGRRGVMAVAEVFRQERTVALAYQMRWTQKKAARAAKNAAAAA